MRVNTQYGSPYDQVDPVSTGNRSDSTHNGLATDQARDTSIATATLHGRLWLPIANPDTVWMRLQGFEKHVHQIEQRQREGSALSDTDRSALATYDELRTDPLFSNKRNRGEPTFMPRVADNPNGAGTTASDPANRKDDGPGRQYRGGVRIKSDYTFEEGADIFIDALRNPFGSFGRSATDSYLKMMAGRPISVEEGQTIDRYAQFVDAAFSITPQGQAMTATAYAVEAAKYAKKGELPPPDSMEAAMQSATNVPGRTRPGNQPQTRQPITTFKPPTRLPDGRVGYPLSPTQPPRLPKETPGSGPSERTPGSPTRPPRLPKENPGGRPSEGASSSQPGPSSGARSESSKPGPQKGTSGKTGATPRRPPERPAGASRKKGPTDIVRNALSRMRKSSVRNGHVERLIGKGPFNVEPPANAAEENRRINEFPVNFDFYRKDGEGGMSYGINTEHVLPAKEAIPDVRKDVLTVGNGSQVTSEESHSKVRLGDQWGPSKKRLPKDVSVIELGNGRNGVGAIRIPYENLKPGQTVVVTGGSLSGCTMMFASDTGHFYAYHAGTYGEGKGQWTTSHDGANAIRYASSRMTNDTSADPHNYEGNNNDLIYVGNKYPFSVIVYNGKHASPDASGSFLKPSDPQPLDARITVYQGARNHGTHAFDYHISNQEVGQLGTAEAVISKDKQGVVTVRVLAEKGEVELPGPRSRQGGKYTYTEAKTYEYKPGE